MCTQLGAKLQNMGLIRRIVKTLPCSSSRAESQLAGGTPDTGTTRKRVQSTKNQAVPPWLAQSPNSDRLYAKSLGNLRQVHTLLGTGLLPLVWLASSCPVSHWRCVRKDSLPLGLRDDVRVADGRVFLCLYSWFLFGSALLLVSVSIAFFCIVYLEWYRGIEDYDIKYPALIPITTATFIVAGIWWVTFGMTNKNKDCLIE